MIRGSKIEDRQGVIVPLVVAPAPGDDDSEGSEPVARRKKASSFPFVFVALLLLSLALFCGLFYASVHMVVVADRDGEYYLSLPSQDDLVREARNNEHDPSTSEGYSSTAAAKDAEATKDTSHNNLPVEKKTAAIRRRSDPTPVPSAAAHTSSPYAYAFLLVGCDAKHPESYRPLLSSIYVAIYLLRKYGSAQDMIVYVMMTSEDDKQIDYESTSTSNATTKKRTKAITTTLSAEELRVLTELNATVRQIPSVPNPTFHRITLQKFRVLGLTQYRRVMFLDCDVMPLLNLDLFFELSDPLVTPQPVLKENLIFLDYVSPANAGNFMLAPHKGDLELVNDMVREAQLIRNQGVEGKEPWRQFQPDRWDGFDQAGTEYNFHLVSGDQGLLWSWVRHYQRQFSYVVKDGVVRNYGPTDNDKYGVRLESFLNDPFGPDRDYVWPVETSVWGTRSDALRYRAAHPPKPGVVTKPHEAHMGAFGSLFHFLLATGGKPWYREGCKERWDAARMPATHRGANISHAERARRVWCHTYHEVSVRHNISVPAASLNGLSKPDASYHPSIGSEMWATPGPITNLLDPDFDPRPFAAASQ
jgi:hypothetical protein